jgi:hypothetical protein
LTGSFLQATDFWDSSLLLLMVQAAGKLGGRGSSKAAEKGFAL